MVRSLLFFFVFVLLVVPSRPTRAAPRGVVATDDALADGEVDPEDLVARSTVGRATVRTSPGGQAWLSFVGFTRRTITNEREIGGFVVVGLPLDRLSRPSPRAALLDPPPPGLGPGLAVPVALDIADDPTLAINPRTARMCVDAAWRASGLAADDARLDAIVSRARWSGVLPEARLRAVRFDDARLSTDTGTDSARWRDSAGANVGLEARVTWRLDRLLYADDEPAFERMKLERHDARFRIAARVLEALFHWQRALLDLRAIPPVSRGARDETDAALRLLEAEASLDVMTGGWFSAWRAQHGPRMNVVVPERAGGDL